MKYGIFGGSFNPPHKGHRYLLDCISSRLELDRVIVIPSNVSPFKKDNLGISNSDRIEMCRLAFECDKYEISQIETDRGGKSYTYITVDTLKTMYPNDEFYLFMGTDMLLSFHNWVNYKHILDNVTICATVRDSISASELKSYVENVLTAEDKVIVVDVEPFEVSSTKIRKMIKNNEDVSCYLNEKVIKYIKDRGLYVEQ